MKNKEQIRIWNELLGKKIEVTKVTLEKGSLPAIALHDFLEATLALDTSLYEDTKKHLEEDDNFNNTALKLDIELDKQSTLRKRLGDSE